MSSNGCAKLLFVLVGVLLSGGTGVRAADANSPNPFLPEAAADRGWPFVRGPNFDGASAEIHLAEEWPAAGPPVLWTRSLGQGYSGFVAQDDRVYTQYQDFGGQYVVCLAADTGKTIWRCRYDWPYELAGMYPGPRATPTLAAGRIYFAAPSGVVGCLSGRGSLVWSVDLKQQFQGRGTDFGYACSPTVDRDLLFLPVGGKRACMVALDAGDGSLVWAAGSDSASYTPAMPIVRDGRRQVVGYLEHALVGFDYAGAELWRVELSKGYDEHAAWPIYQEPLLWISGPFRSGCKLFEIPSERAGRRSTVGLAKRTDVERRGVQRVDRRAISTASTFETSRPSCVALRAAASAASNCGPATSAGPSTTRSPVARASRRR